MIPCSPVSDSGISEIPERLPLAPWQPYSSPGLPAIPALLQDIG